MSLRKLSVALLALSLSFTVVSCKKKPPVTTQTPPPPQPPPPPPPAPAAVVRSFSVEPSSITAGQSATLRWAVENADTVTISGLGTVQASGSRSVNPDTTTTYRLTATGRGGNAERSVTLTVRPVPPPPPEPTRPAQVSLEEMVRSMLSDAYFDYDKSEIRDDARAVLNKNGEALKSIFAAYPNAVVTIEGHCDERGSAEYNLGLGDRRSTSAKEYLVNLGVPGDKLKVISYGNEKPQCTDANESCWQKNRRAHFSVN